LMSLIIENFGEGGIKLSAMNGVSFASLDEELLRLMKRAGFHTINLSFVSIDSSTKERMRRPQSTADFDKILENAEQGGLNVVAYAILGMPGQTIGEMVETLIYLMGTKVLIGPSVYYPTPGTPLFEACEKEGILPPDRSRWRSSAFPIETKEFNRLDLSTLFRLARVINFVKGEMDRGEFSEGMTWKEVIQVLRERRKAKDDEVGAGEDAKAWIDLILQLFNERSLFSVRKDSRGRKSFMKEKSSKKILDYFFDKAWENPILKSRTD